MNTSFNEKLWIDYDLEIAVFLQNIAGWIRYNISKDDPNKRNLHDGRYWSYNSNTELSKQFLGWSGQTIRRIIKRAIDANLLIKGNFNKKKYDNTSWYALSDKGIEYFPLLAVSDLYTPVGIDSTPVGIDRPIPQVLNHKDLLSVYSEKQKDLERYTATYELASTTPQTGLIKSEPTESQKTFALFFEIYPIKKNELRAQAAWLSQNCHVISETIMIKLKKQIAKDADFIGKYVVNPDKYIMQEKWRDEIKPVRSKSKKSPAMDNVSTEWRTPPDCSDLSWIKGIKTI